MNVEYNIESAIPLAANATVNGNPIDGVAVGKVYTDFRAFESSDQLGTLSIQQSPDGKTWYKTLSVAGVADATQGSVLESLWTLRYIRCSYTNGATPQTSFLLASELVIE